MLFHLFVWSVGHDCRFHYSVAGYVVPQYVQTHGWVTDSSSRAQAQPTPASLIQNQKSLERARNEG